MTPPLRSIGAVVVISVGALLVSGCTSLPSVPADFVATRPIRFLLTFDDGPSAAAQDNPTEKILDVLADNPTQPDIKGIFFVQTRWAGAGGSPVGLRLMHRTATEGHVLAVHSGSPRGHLNHRSFGAEELAATLSDCRTDIRTISGEAADLVRPPYWSFDASTLAVYDQSQMGMLLTDLRINDGMHWLFQADPESGGRLLHDFEHFRKRLAAGYIPTVNGVIPVVVTFHDVNPYTARHLATYLATLVRNAREMGFTVAEPPFYAEHADAWRAARARSNNHATRADLAR